MLRACNGQHCKGCADGATHEPSARMQEHQCVDPLLAQSTRAVRVPGFLSQDEMADIHAAARELRPTAASKLASIQPSGEYAWRTLFLHSGMVRKAVLWRP